MRGYLRDTQLVVTIVTMSSYRLDYRRPVELAWSLPRRDVLTSSCPEILGTMFGRNFHCVGNAEELAYFGTSLRLNCCRKIKSCYQNAFLDSSTKILGSPINFVPRGSLQLQHLVPCALGSCRARNYHWLSAFLEGRIVLKR